MSSGSTKEDAPDAHVLSLYPQGEPPRAVRGLYLDPQVESLNRAASRANGRPLIYANFVSSLDGRIAVGGTEADSHVPRSLTTRADWRLFQELQAHADCFITHGAYLRALAAGRLSDILQVGLRRDAADIARWRKGQGRDVQPAVVVASRSLDFELPSSLRQHDQPVMIVTTRDAPDDRVRYFRDRGVDVEVTSAATEVTGRSLVAAVKRLGRSRAYLEAGPAVLGAMLRERCLDRLYLTLGHRLLGGDAFHTLLHGEGLAAEAGGLALERLYYLAPTARQDGQFFASFSPKNGPPHQGHSASS